MLVLTPQNDAHDILLRCLSSVRLFASYITFAYRATSVARTRCNTCTYLQLRLYVVRADRAVNRRGRRAALISSYPRSNFRHNQWSILVTVCICSGMVFNIFSRSTHSTYPSDIWCWFVDDFCTNHHTWLHVGFNSIRYLYTSLPLCSPWCLNLCWWFISL